MNVVLINPPQNTKYPQPPMGLALLGAILEREGHRVTVIDANVRSMTLDNILRWVFACSADIVGITAMTPTVNSALDIARRLKWHNPELFVVLGGVHASLLPLETMEVCNEIDVLVKGEGDETLPRLLKVLSEKKVFAPIQSVNGIVCRLNELLCHIPDKDSEVSLDDLPYLGYSLLPWRDYRPHPPHGRDVPWLAMITSRGCPYSCSFCSRGVFGNKFRAQSPVRVVDEVVYYRKNFGVKEIAFYDDVFTLDRNRAYGIADEILRRNLKLCWNCETRVNLVDSELLKHMKRAGCYSIAYGIESGCQEILDTIDKHITLEQCEETIRKTREAGIQTVGYFMIGSPNETKESIRKTIDFAKKLKLDYAQFSITVPFPGTNLYNMYIDGNKQAIPWESFVYASTGSKTSPIFESGDLSRDDIQGWASRAYKEFYLRPSYVLQRLSRIKSFGDVKVLVKGLSMLRGM